MARDAQDHNFWSKPVRRFYVSYFQPIDGITAANFAIRTVGDPAALDALLRREVKALDGNLMVLRIREVKSLMDQSLVQERLIAKLSSFFGLLAATLAAIGLYGVMAYDVVQRTKEIGVRMALGAQKINILSLVVGQGMKLALAGLGVGVLAALALTRIVRSLLYGTTPTDPVTFIAKLERAARERVFVMMRETDLPHPVAEIRRRLRGETGPRLPRFSELFMLLLEVGIAPDVAFLKYPIMTRYSDMDEALADSRALFGGGWDEAAGRAVLEEILQRDGDELVFDGGVALSGVAHWQPRES